MQNWVEQQHNPDYYSNRLLKSNFKPLIPVKDSLVSEKVSKEEKRKKQSSKSTGKKTRKEKAEYQLQKNLRKGQGPSIGHGPSRPVFQSSLLPAIATPDQKLSARSHAPDKKKPSKVHPVDFDVNPNKETAVKPEKPFNADRNGSNKEDWDSAKSVPALVEDLTSPINPMNKPQSPRPGGLVVSRHNKVHPLNTEGSSDVQTAFADESMSFYEQQWRDTPVDLIELESADQANTDPKYAFDLEDKPGSSKV